MKALSSGRMKTTLIWARYGCRRFTTDGSETLNFGKHKGKTYEHVVANHAEYTQWLKKQENLSTDAKRFLQYADAGNGSTSRDAPATSWSKSRDPPATSWNKFRSSVTQPQYSRSNTSTSYAKPAGASPRRQKDPFPTSPVTGTTLVTFGKYAGQTYSSVFERDPKFCLGMVKLSREESIAQSLLPFIIYCQQRYLQPTTSTEGLSTIEAPAMCLKGKTYTLSGDSVGVYSRAKSQECLERFGAIISGTVTKKCTALILVSAETLDGRPMEDSTKYVAAESRDIEIIPIATFLEKLHKPGENTVKYKF